MNHWTPHADSYAIYVNELALKEKRIELLEASLRECVTWMDALGSALSLSLPPCVVSAQELLS